MRAADGGGGLLGGLCFVLSGFAVLLILTMGYAALGVTPILRGALDGLGPVVLGIYLVAVYRLGRVTVTGRSQVVLAVAAAVAILAGPLGVAGILLLAGGVGIWLCYSKKLGVVVLAPLAACLGVGHIVARSVLALRGIASAVIGVLAVSLLRLAPHALPDALALATLAATVVLPMMWRVGTFKVMLLGAALGIARSRLAAFSGTKALLSTITRA